MRFHRSIDSNQSSQYASSMAVLEFLRNLLTLFQDWDFARERKNTSSLSLAIEKLAEWVYLIADSNTQHLHFKQ